MSYTSDVLLVASVASDVEMYRPIGSAAVLHGAELLDVLRLVDREERVILRVCLPGLRRHYTATAQIEVYTASVSVPYTGLANDIPKHCKHLYLTPSMFRFPQ